MLNHKEYCFTCALLTAASGCGGEVIGSRPNVVSEVTDASSDSVPDGAAGSKPDADAAMDSDGQADTEAGCSKGFKSCSGKCVADDDPATGCAAASCEACAIPHAEPTCSDTGSCGIGQCDQGYADCDSASLNGCEVLISNDPKNCGACGHDCLGGTCSNGKCSPVVIASGQTNPWSVAVDATHVYWTNRVVNSGSVRRAAITGGAVQILAASQNDPDGIAVNSTHVFWANVGGDTVIRLDKAGVASPEIIGVGDAACGVSVTDQVIAWTNWGQDSVAARKLDGSSSWVVSTGQLDPHRIVTDGTWVWWTNWTGYNSDGTVRRARLDGTEAATIATGQSQPIGVAIDGADVYWSNEGDGRIMRRSAFGAGQPTTMATGQTNTSAVVVDSSHIYFNSFTLGTISRMLKSAPMGVVETLATGQGAPTYIADDAVSIYWTNRSSGTIMRLAK